MLQPAARANAGIVDGYQRRPHAPELTLTHSRLLGLEHGLIVVYESVFNGRLQEFGKLRLEIELVGNAIEIVAGRRGLRCRVLQRTVKILGRPGALVGTAPVRSTITAGADQSTSVQMSARAPGGTLPK